MTPNPPIGAAVRLLLRQTIDAYRDSPQAVGWLQHNLARFDEPLRVAIAGKVKAGKSTLLNALVGESIAPTDAGECTRIVTWYIDSQVPKVTMFPRSAPPRQLAITRSGGALSFDLQGTPVEQVDKLEVQWPSQSLRNQTLIDTPGIASLSTETSARAGAFLAPEDSPTQADAVIYLMRHLHATDVRFLESFFDQGVAKATPINTIAVLSRADEIGVGRLDALSSARRIARRYRADDKIRGLCQTVVAVAGLLAQTGRTMRQQEFAALTVLAGLPRAELDAMLLSVDRFSRAELADPDSETRTQLMERFGLFGVRLSTTLIRQGIKDPNQIATELVRRSGLDELRSVLATQFTERRDLLKARSALLAIDLVLTREPPAGVGSAGRRGGTHPGGRARVRRAPAALDVALRSGTAAGRGARRGGTDSRWRRRIGSGPARAGAGRGVQRAAVGRVGRGEPVAAAGGEPDVRARGGRRGAGRGALV